MTDRLEADGQIQKAEVDRPGLVVEYDPVSDVLTIEGTRYAGGLFRALGSSGLRRGAVVRIHDNTEGQLTLTALPELESPPTPPPDAYPRCPFCAATDCPWLVDLIERESLSWHPRNLSGAAIPHLAPMLGGAMVLQNQVTGGMMPRLLYDDHAAAARELRGRLIRGAAAAQECDHVDG